MFRLIFIICMLPTQLHQSKIHSRQSRNYMQPANLREYEYLSQFRVLRDN